MYQPDVKLVKDEIVEGDAYLYSLWKRGQLRVYEGRVRHRVWKYDHFDSTKESMTFLCKERLFTGQKEGYDCALEEGVVYNKMLWLSTRDDRKAKDIFIKYEEYQISILEERIEGHREIIELLRE